MAEPDNPFAARGIVTGAAFTDRADERRALRRALTAAPGYVLLAGARRIGKSSLLAQVHGDLTRARHPVLLVDLWTAATPGDVVTRLVQGATRELGRRWREATLELLARLKLSFTLDRQPDGTLLPRPELALQAREPAALARDLVATLDALEAMAAKRGAVLGLILDEFQHVATLFGDDVFRQLRAAIQRHRHVSYVFAGSDSAVIDRLLARDAALFKMLTQLTVGPLPEAHHAAWIEDQFRRAGMPAAAGTGLALIAAAGPRTWDVRETAFWLFEHARATRRPPGPDGVGAAMLAVVAAQQPALERGWRSLTPPLQRMTRAAAAETEGLTSRAVLVRYGFASSSHATKALKGLVERGILARTGEGAYVFDDPFFRRWVLSFAMEGGAVEAPPGVSPVPRGGRGTGRRVKGRGKKR
jgi:hypothetical protein